MSPPVQRPAAGPTTPRRERQPLLPAPWVVMLAGVVAAMHIGKMAPALPTLQAALGVSLVQAGFLLSTAQLAGMLLGVVVGGLTDGLGLRRSLLAGLCLMALASALGAGASSGSALLVCRGLEGLGVLWVVLPVPSLVRRLVSTDQLARHLGWWGAYMPTGTAMALLGGPAILAVVGWQGLWGGMAAASAAMAAWVWHTVPPDPARPSNNGGGPPAATGPGAHRWTQRLHLTLTTPGPWLVALLFAMYSSQWLAVIGFLPSVYAQAGVATATAGVLTAGVCAVNTVGNVGAGQLLHRGWSATRLLVAGFGAMAVCTWLAFHPWTSDWPVWRYLACALFSAAGGLIPGSLFFLAVRVAPSEQTVSTTVGWMQQCSSTGQFAGPPLVAWVAHQVGGWHLTWAVTGSASLLGLLLVAVLRQHRDCGTHQ